MATVYIAPTFGVGFQAFTAAGLPLSGGLIYTYAAGTTTPQATYTASDGVTPNANPIVLGADGRPPNEIWLTSNSYRFDLKDSLGNTLGSFDNIPSGFITAATLAASGGSADIGFIQSGTGPNAARTVQAKLREAEMSPQDKGAAADSTTDDLTDVNAAIADALTDGDKAIHLDGDYYVSASPTNTRGIEYHGGGRLLTDTTGGKKQLNSYADFDKYIVGREYLSSFHKLLLARTAVNIRFSGDSTTDGTSATTPYRIWELVPEMAHIEGYYGVTGTNAGHGGDGTTQWLASYLATDLSANPDLYVIRWGINDPYLSGAGLTAQQFIDNIRTGLATIRANTNGGQSDMSVVLMAPNSTSDTTGARDEKWYEQVVPGLKKAARDYQCCFIDTYAYLQDSRNAVDYMDDPYALTAGSFVVGNSYEIVSVGTTDFTLVGAAYNKVGQKFVATGVGTGTGTATDGRHIHPLNVMNTWISTLICDAIFPKGLQQISENRVRNISGTFAPKAGSDATSTYSKGITISRATPSGTGSAWPYDGGVVTFGQADNTQLQINWSFVASKSSVAFRTGQSGVWQAWNWLPDTTVTAWTPVLYGLTTAGTNTYSTQTGYYVRNGNLITAHFRLTMTAKDVSMAGNLAIGGLPAASSSLMPNASGMISRYQNINLQTSQTQLGIAVPASSSYGQLWQSGDNTSAQAITASDVFDNTEIFGCLSYFV